MAPKDDIRQLPQQDDRVETGAVQFGNDWPGLFIRGDDCFALALDVRRVLDAVPKPVNDVMACIAIAHIQRLLRLLTTPLVHPGKQDLLDMLKVGSADEVKE